MYNVVERLNCITSNEEIGFSSNEQYMRKVLVKDKTVKHDKGSLTTHVGPLNPLNFHVCLWKYKMYHYCDCITGNIKL